MNTPKVYVPGFPRCGTTFIGQVLHQHPEIHVPLKAHPRYPYPVKKEIHFFNKVPFTLNNLFSYNPDYLKSGIEYYKTFFADNKINIDFSICSGYDLECAEKVREELGDIKILFFTRNKVDHQKSIEVLTKEKAQEFVSDFDTAINQFQKVFSDVKIIDLNKIKKDPKKVLREILKFIGVKDLDFKFNLEVSKHSSEEVIKYTE